MKKSPCSCAMFMSLELLYELGSYVLTYAWPILKCCAVRTGYDHDYGPRGPLLSSVEAGHRQGRAVGVLQGVLCVIKGSKACAHAFRFCGGKLIRNSAAN